MIMGTAVLAGLVLDIGIITDQCNMCIRSTSLTKATEVERIQNEPQYTCMYSHVHCCGLRYASMCSQTLSTLCLKDESCMWAQ